MGRSLASMVWLAASCISPPTFIPCGDLLCPTTTVCTVGGCADPADVAPCVGKTDGDVCSSSKTVAGTCHAGVCHPVACGNGIVDVGYTEVCDDNNQAAGDGCSPDCRSNEVCGNGIADFVRDEQCDVGIAGLSSDGCSSTCQVELAIWREEIPPMLEYRELAPLAFDSRRGVTVMFGGKPARDETWEWDGTGWARQFPITIPPPRETHAMAYDSKRGRVVMFGGSHYSAPSLYHDTWEWDGVNWTKRSDSGPEGRAMHAMAYDENLEKVILVGGNDDSGMRSSSTWAWDGATWMQLAPLTPAPARSHHALAYDGVREELVLYGGMSGSGAYPRDTWVFDGSTWREAATTGPDVTNRVPASVFDGSVIVMVGDASGEHVWTWDGSSWSQRPDPALTPPFRQWHRIAYDTARQRVVMYGGTKTDLDTWEWNGATWFKLSSMSLPATRTRTSLAYDTRRGRLVLFGGGTDVPFPSTLTDTWEWDGRNWRLRATGGPYLTQQVPMIYDPANDEMMIYVGGPAASSVTQIWDGMSWSMHSGAGPGSRNGYATAYDARRRRVVLFGGSTTETWVWDGATRTWSLASANGPAPRTGHVMAYDYVRERIVVFGGIAGGTRLRDVWEWDGTTWSDRTPTELPVERVAMTATYDPLRQRVVIHGGIEYVDDEPRIAVGALEWDGVSFRTIVPTVDAPIGELAIAFDGVGRQLMTSYAGANVLALWGRRFEVVSGNVERCLVATEDTDGDGRMGCADIDCYPRCSPLCPPGAACDPSEPRCGDGMCGAVEDYLICPDDCPGP